MSETSMLQGAFADEVASKSQVIRPGNWLREARIRDLIVFFYKAVVALIVVGVTVGIPALFLFAVIQGALR